MRKTTISVDPIVRACSNRFIAVFNALFAVLIVGFTPQAWALTPDDLRADAPPCKQTKAKRPKLAADKEIPYIDVYRLDFNGDGWCDYALGVPYPFNSQMNSYSLDELILLGGKQSWGRAVKGKPVGHFYKSPEPATLLSCKRAYLTLRTATPA